MVEIAKALVHESDILIMDEPTTVLTNLEVEILFDLDKQTEREEMSPFCSSPINSTR